MSADKETVTVSLVALERVLDAFNCGLFVPETPRYATANCRERIDAAIDALTQLRRALDSAPSPQEGETP